MVWPGLSPIGRPLDIIPLYNFLFRIEHICHNHEITFPYHFTLSIFLNQLMKPEEFSNKSLRVLFNIVIIVFKYCSQLLVLSIVYSLQHVLAISCIIEEWATLSLARQSWQRSHFAHHQRCHEFVGADAVDVLLIVDVENAADVVKGVWSVVSKAADSGEVSVIPEPPGHQFKVVLEIKVFGLLIDHFLVASDTAHCHLNTNHHVED